MKVKNGSSKRGINPEAQIRKRIPGTISSRFRCRKTRSGGQQKRRRAESGRDTVVMVLRGLVDTNFKTTAVKVYALIKDWESICLSRSIRALEEAG